MTNIEQLQEYKAVVFFQWIQCHIDLYTGQSDQELHWSLCAIIEFSFLYLFLSVKCTFIFSEILLKGYVTTLLHLLPLISNPASSRVSFAQLSMHLYLSFLLLPISEAQSVAWLLCPGFAFACFI